MSVFEPDALMLQNYMQNKLSDVNTERVELWLAEHPEIIDELEVDLIFKEAIEIEQKTEEKKNKNLNLLDFFINRKFIPLHLFAYGMLAFLMLNTLMKSEQDLSVATFIEFEKQRGLDTSTIEVKNSNGQSLVLRFFPDSLTENYLLVMQSEAKNEKIEFKNLIADDDGSITVSINHTNQMVGEWKVFIVDSANKQEQKSLLSIY